MRRVVLLILDGLRRDMMRPELTPNLAALAARSDHFTRHRSVFPSATRVVSASVATGCHPGRHELQGNTLVLVEAGRLVVHDAGAPEFLQHKRRVTGRALAFPTLAERLAAHGGAKIFSNVSPGAAYAHDPDGHGHVYHRAGSFGPGRVPVAGWNAADIPFDAQGDRQLAERAIAMAIAPPAGMGPPALTVLWLSEPDHTSHEAPLGSPAHLEAIRQADRTAGAVIAAVEARRAAGEDILLLAGSDHGHQTVSGVVDVGAELVAAGLKLSSGSDDVIAASNGTAALVYVAPEHAARTARIAAFLAVQPWAGEVIGVDGLGRIGQVARHGLAVAVTMAADDEPNEFGVPGRAIEARPGPGKADHLGCGQHGGLAAYEQGPLLIASGAGFGQGRARNDASSAIDLAPTILAHLGLPADGTDGRPLQATDDRAA